jgi:hypothetical protein
MPFLRTLPAGFGGLGGVAAFDPTKLAPLYAPPALVADMGMRFLAVFAFMQTMHYVVWVAVLPRYAPEAAARFAQGKAIYAAGASYHAYLEFPVLLALMLAYAPGAADRTNEAAA